jgi:plastocyanin
VRARLLLLPLVVAVAVVGCGDDDEPVPAAGCHEAVDGSVEITADDLSWDTDCLEAPAGEALTIVIHNDEDGVNHNLHLPEAPGSPATKLVQGPATQELVLDPGLAPGTYEFLCDIHPNMVGQLQVDEANPPAEP